MATDVQQHDLVEDLTDPEKSLSKVVAIDDRNHKVMLRKCNIWGEIDVDTSGRIVDFQYLKIIARKTGDTIKEYVSYEDWCLLNGINNSIVEDIGI